MNALQKLTKREKGMSLIEVMIAMVVLMVGVLAVMSLIAVAIGSNARNRRDSTGTMLAEMVLDQISAIPVGASPSTVSISEPYCPTSSSTNSYTIESAGSPSGAGANLSGSNIDFTQSPATITANYSMMYTVCGPSNDTRTVYDVRWNVQTITANSNFVTVAARLRNSGTDPRIFAIPVTLRTVVGNAGN
jgi:Tfp pilus assembly protein PilV